MIIFHFASDWGQKPSKWSRTTSAPEPEKDLSGLLEKLWPGWLVFSGVDWVENLTSFHVIKFRLREAAEDRPKTDQTRPRCDKIWKILADAATIDTIRQFYCVMALVRARITDIFMYWQASIFWLCDFVRVKRRKWERRASQARPRCDKIWRFWSCMATQDTIRQLYCALVGSLAKNTEIFYIFCVHKIPILQLIWWDYIFWGYGPSRAKMWQNMTLPIKFSL